MKARPSTKSKRYVLIENMQCGEIYWGNRREHPDAEHPIVYVAHSGDPAYFTGLMLSTKRSFGRNIKMSRRHFSDDFPYDNTHVVAALLLKPYEWGDFHRMGNLTDTGLLFVQQHIDIWAAEAITWEQYLAQSNQ